MAFLCLKPKTSLSPSYAPPPDRRRNCALIFPAAHGVAKTQSWIVSVWWGVSRRLATSHETSCPASLKKRGFMFSFVAHGLPSLPGELHPASGCYLARISVHLSASAEWPPRATIAQLPPISLGVAMSFQDWLDWRAKLMLPDSALGTSPPSVSLERWWRSRLLFWKIPFQKLRISLLVPFSSGNQRSQSETSECNPFWTRICSLT